MTNSALQYRCSPVSIGSYSTFRPFGWLLLLMGIGCGMNLRGSEVAETEYALPAVDYFPDHPVVQEMVEKAVRYLEKETTFTGFGVPGELIFTAVAVQKVRADPSNPVVRAGLAAANRVVQNITNPQSPESSVYDSAVAALLFCAVDAVAYRAQLDVIHDFLMRVQRPYGAYGYISGAHLDTGDTSQTQYAILALWTMDQAGIETDPERIESLVKWLQQTQDPSGAWGYQGVIARGGGLVQQTEVRSTLVAAGYGSLLIGGDLLGFYRNRRGEMEEDYVPKAFRRVVEVKANEKKKQVSMHREDIDATVQRATKWLAANPYTRIQSWHYYYMYSEERMQSFIEISQGKQQKSPAWYNRGVEQLRKDQSPEGGWGVTQADRDYSSSQVCTAFGVLYLIRSTQKAIGVLNEGIQRGGWSLPKDVSNIEDVDGKIIDRSKANSLDEILGSLESEDPSKGDDVVVSEKLKLDKDPKRRREQLNRLGRLLSSKDVKARQTAAKLIGRGDDLELVPLLIYGLGDGDRVVCKNAEASLRIISRRLDVKHLPNIEDIGDRHYTEAEKKRAQEAWKAWFLTVRPDYTFVDKK